MSYTDRYTAHGFYRGHAHHDLCDLVFGGGVAPYDKCSCAIAKLKAADVEIKRLTRRVRFLERRGSKAIG